MVLRSGNELEGPKIEASKDKDEEEIEREIEKAAHEEPNKVTSETPTYPKTSPTPFPCSLEKPRKSDKNKEMVEMFRKLGLSIPLLDVIKQVPKYAEFLRNFARIKRDCKEMSALLLPRVYLLLYNIKSLLTVAIQANELIVPVDFYVLDMRDDNSPNPSQILLGRPFMCIVQTKIDVKQGILSMEFDGEKVQFNISDAMKYPGESNVLYSLDVFYEIVQEILTASGKDPLEIVLHTILMRNSVQKN
ncbi:uncharacterized protein LOC127261967 [Andrographis paniculata]|uniref:uncharacterized protein LOC127261967 n=1 Tax=Andrographis paniculata TaxID=175694 RepID=UPI0021E933A1|nr:uncharacterized protein LOC127261967 [Andrographis paniculata]